MERKPLSIDEIMSRGRVPESRTVHIKSLNGEVELHAVDFLTLVELRQLHGDKFPIAIVAEALKMPYQQAFELSNNHAVFQEISSATTEFFSPTITDDEIKN